MRVKCASPVDENTSFRAWFEHLPDRVLKWIVYSTRLPALIYLPPVHYT